MNNTSLRIPGFTTLSSPRAQTCALIYGIGGSGKSTFVAKYCPDPIAFINFDGRAQWAIADGMRAGKNIHFARVDTPTDITEVDAKAQRVCKSSVKEFFSLYSRAIKESLRGNIRTITLDTGTELNMLITIAVRGYLGKANDYGLSKQTINNTWWRIFNMARASNAHLVVLARAVDEWKGNSPTGVTLPAGNGVMREACDWAAELRAKVDEKKHKLSRFELQITKAGVNASVLGAVYKQSDWEDEDDGGGFGPFVYACERLYPSVDFGEWV